MSNKYSSTLPFASVGETEKKREPASETVTKVSPAIMKDVHEGETAEGRLLIKEILRGGPR